MRPRSALLNARVTIIMMPDDASGDVSEEDDGDFGIGAEYHAVHAPVRAWLGAAWAALEPRRGADPWRTWAVRRGGKRFRLGCAAVHGHAIGTGPVGDGAKSQGLRRATARPVRCEPRVDGAL